MNAEIYEIIKSQNYIGRDVYSLYIDNYYHCSVSEKTLSYFAQNNIALNDSEQIKKYMKYKNI